MRNIKLLKLGTVGRKRLQKNINYISYNVYNEAQISFHTTELVTADLSN